MILSHGANVKQICNKYNLDENKIIDFSSNINIFTANINYEKILENIKKNINKYPDINYTSLKDNLSKIYDIKRNDIFVGNGAIELIYDIVSLDRFQNIAIFNPNFSEYERAVFLNKKNIIDLDINIIDKIYPNMKIQELFKDACKMPDIIIISNPNNPTGCIKNLKNLLEFCKKNNIFLFVDETFIDFMYNEEFCLKSYVRYYDNLIVLDAISKFYAMTSARLGYIFCSNKDLISCLEFKKKPWSINILAQEIAKELVFVQDTFYIKSKDYFTKESKRLYEKYSKIQTISIQATYAPFFALGLKEKNANDIQKELIKNHNILIRVLDNYKNIQKNSIRIAIKNKDENEKLFRILSDIIQK